MEGSIGASTAVSGATAVIGDAWTVDGTHGTGIAHLAMSVPIGVLPLVA